MEICRLCLSKVEDVTEISSNRELLNKIIECISLEIIFKGNFPKSVCNICLKKVDDWYKFKTMCIHSNKVLEKSCLNGKIEIASLKKLETNCDKKNCVSFNQWGFINENDSLDETEMDTMEEEYKDQSEETVYICNICTKTYEFYIDYLDHQQVHEGEPVFHCEKCRKTYTSKAELAEHERSHKIPCDICGTQVQKQSMKSHLNKHTDRFQCPQCLQCCTSRTLLEEHIVVRHIKIKNHFCDYCGKDFATKGALSIHLKSHSDEKGYKCEQCDYGGKTPMALRIHMSKHENNVCICEYCSKIFKSNRNLKDHLRRVHCTIKNHCCNYCGMKFALRYLLETHLRTHTGIHPYECRRCQKTFARTDGLKEHMKTHDRSEIFDCKICAKTFFTKRGMKRHNCLPLAPT